MRRTGTYGGSSATVLELTPKQPSAQLKQLFFVVNTSDLRPRARARPPGNDVNRILELVWASVTEELLRGARASVEGWGPAATERRKTSTLSSVEPRT